MAYVQFGAEHTGRWFQSVKGLRIAGLAMLTALLLTPAWVLVDEKVIGPAGWVKGYSPLVSNGLVPCVILLAGVTGFYILTNKLFRASKTEAVQALFVLLLTGFLVLTSVGVWFRGAGMALMWPWQI